MFKAKQFSRIRDALHRRLSCWCQCRITPITCDFPIISFTFDDFPKAALENGGKILTEHGVRGTYYASFGLLGKTTPVGLCFSEEDVENVIVSGHELGCHTFSHCHAWDTRPDVFRRELIRNTAAFKMRFPGASVTTMSYPISCPRPANKRVAAQLYSCCRGGGQAFNTGSVDANYVRAFFLEKSRDRPAIVKRLIEENCRAAGWLIFATHDVAPSPTRFGCTSEFFEDIVTCAVRSGARILPVTAAWNAITTRPALFSQ